MLTKSYIKAQVTTALNEDLGIFGDITSQAIINPEQKSEATIVLKQDAVLCGIDFAISSFKQLDKKTKVLSQKLDGKFLKKGTVVLKVKARTQSILAAERSALNFLGLMSGIATKAYTFAKIAKPYGVKIFSTRKTIVGIRELQKYALTKGGANINRMTLDDFFFIKDNHIANATSIIESIAQARIFYPKKKITVEVDNIKQLKEILNEKIDIVLLDNMNAKQIKECLKLVKGKFKCEASGNIKLANLKSIAQTKVDRISTGQLTHSIENIDFGLEL
ncbi:MAG: carboxylating nicotinate-nucleotide diphosphorylase [Pelagibacterales bacterium]|nr:carboxylating nicotinate-nucleotide diphosphorylase [Pelagibacterales bacterium]